MDALDDAIHNSIPGISGGLTDPDKSPFSAGEMRDSRSDRDVMNDIEVSLDKLHHKVDAIVNVVESTVANLGNNPMMQMLSKLAPKAKG